MERLSTEQSLTLPGLESLLHFSSFVKRESDEEAQKNAD